LVQPEKLSLLAMDVAIPKLRSGRHFPDWLLQRRKRAERALTSVVATCYLLGVSIRRMERLVESLGVTSLSKSQVSIMAKELGTCGRPYGTPCKHDTPVSAARA
jgi:transposase-like protein